MQFDRNRGPASAVAQHSRFCRMGVAKRMVSCIGRWKKPWLRCSEPSSSMSWPSGPAWPISQATWAWARILPVRWALAAVVKWFIRLIALVMAFDALGLPVVSDVLRQLLPWLPNVVVALVVLVIGGLLASALSDVVRGAAAKSALCNPELLAKVASGLVWAFAIVVAVNQIGIATALVNTLVMALVGAVALALGLAFGLGGRETAAEIVRNWYASSQQNQEKLARAASEAGADVSNKAA